MRLSPRILGENTEVVCHVLLHRIFPAQGSNSDLLIASGFFSPFEPPGKPKNTGVGSLFLLQESFPTQKANQGLLLCRQVLYQLSYQGSPRISDVVSNSLLRIPLISSSVTFLSSTSSADVSLTSAREFSLISKAFVIILDLFK